MPRRLARDLVPDRQLDSARQLWDGRANRIEVHAFWTGDLDHRPKDGDIFRICQTALDLLMRFEASADFLRPETAATDKDRD